MSTTLNPGTARLRLFSIPQGLAPRFMQANGHHIDGCEFKIEADNPDPKGGREAVLAELQGSVDRVLSKLSEIHPPESAFEIFVSYRGPSLLESIQLTPEGRHRGYFAVAAGAVPAEPQPAVVITGLDDYRGVYEAATPVPVAAETSGQPLGTAIKGYNNAPTEAQRREANLNKEIEEICVRRLEQLRHRTHPSSTREPEIDGRLLALGHTWMQMAWMLVNRAIFQPGRAELPEGFTIEAALAEAQARVAAAD